MPMTWSGPTRELPESTGVTFEAIGAGEGVDAFLATLTEALQVPTTAGWTQAHA